MFLRSSTVLRVQTMPQTTNIYMARAPNGDVANWNGDGQVWFKVHEITAVTNGGSSISFPSNGPSSSQVEVPRLTNFIESRNAQHRVHDPPFYSFRSISRPHRERGSSFRTGSRRWSVRTLLLSSAWSITKWLLHPAQWYISCAQIEVVNGGNGNPGPLVSIPGLYQGNEPGIMLNIYYPVPRTYVQPGPVSRVI